MNKTIVGIVALGLGTLGLNAIQDESPKPNSTSTVITEEKTTTPPKNRYQETETPVIFKTIEKERTSNSNCDPNYSGCVPIASDVDCAGGKGNGPAYVRGPVRVIGSDIYDLDRDNDGLGCE